MSSNTQETYISGHPLDECTCADYRRDHEGGTGICKVCLSINPPWFEKCQHFVLRTAATWYDVERFRKMGIEYPEVKP